jgi:hypothetical protein
VLEHAGAVAHNPNRVRRRTMGKARVARDGDHEFLDHLGERVEAAAAILDQLQYSQLFLRAEGRREARGAAGRADSVDRRGRETSAPGATEGDAQPHGGGVMGPGANRRRERAEERRRFCETGRAIRALTLEQVLHVVGRAWRDRRRRPHDWKIIAITVNYVRSQQEEAWLRRQLEGLGKEGS